MYIHINQRRLLTDSSINISQRRLLTNSQINTRSLPRTLLLLTISNETYQCLPTFMFHGELRETACYIARKSRTYDNVYTPEDPRGSWQLTEIITVLPITREKFSPYFEKYVECVISGFRNEADEDCALLDYEAATSGNFVPTFPDNSLVVPKRRQFPILGVLRGIQKLCIPRFLGIPLGNFREMQVGKSELHCM